MTMTDHIQLPPPDYTENVQGFVHDTQRHYYSEETMRAYAERLHAARVNSPAIMQAIGLLTTLQSWIGPRRPENSEPEEQALWDQTEATRIALTPLAPAGAPTTQAAPAHPDDAAVDALAAAMRAKLTKQRAKGYSGWDTTEFTQQRLSDMLREHVDKGDPVDVANFCAFLAARGEGIAQAAPAAVAVPSKAVAYLDIGSGGYLDIGTDLDDEELLKLPSGRHMLAIVGTFGVDGYTPAAAPTTQAAPQPAPIFGDEDHVLVPRGLLGAACSAINKKRDGVKTLTELRRYTTGDLSKAAPQQDDQKPYAYAVYFPDQPTVELVHDLDDLTDDLTNREHQITRLYAAPQAAPAAQGDADDPLQGAAQWLLEALEGCNIADLQSRLLIGLNRAERLMLAALAARSQAKEGGA